MKIFLSVLTAMLLTVFLLVAVARGIHVAEHGFQSSSFDLQQGRAIFSARCARCHNVNGTSAAIGPNLAMIGSVAGQRKPGLNASEYLLESILKPREFKAPGSSGEMPVNLVNSYDDGAVRGLVAYLNSMGGTAQDDLIRALEIERPKMREESVVFERDQILRGEELYRGKAGCAVCHPFYGGKEYELTAPYVFYRGYRDKEELRRALVAPHSSVAARYQQTTVVLSTGNVVTGLLISQDETSVVMLVRENGQINRQTIPSADIERNDDGTLMVETNSVSAMPAGIDQLLTAAEIDDLLQFLMAAN